jgi:peptidoglycan/xylan/chitin deacetylase (PgdA/CDA1 family)
LIRNISILQFHNVTDAEKQCCLWLPLTAFKRYLSYLKRNGFEIIALAKAIEMMGRPFLGTKKRPISLTFDHGYADFSDSVFPLLQESGIPATLFICPDKIGKTTSKDHCSVDHLSADQLRKIAENGITIGAYEDAAWNINQIDQAMVRRHIREYKKRLEDLLGKKVKYFGVKEGVPSRQLREILISAGYDAFLTQCPTYRRPDPYAIGRIQVDDDDFNIFLTKISKTYLFFKDKRSWKYIREYKLDRVAHRVSETVDRIRGLHHEP